MLHTRARVSSKMDTGRLAQAVSRPGIDPRAWVSLAVALGESKVDPKYGVFVNVQLMPTGEKYTAVVASDYVGPGFGFYTPIHLHDDLIVVIPGGDPRLGVTVVKRLWTAADTPPAEAVLDPAEIMLVVEKDKNLRLKVTGSGKVEIDSDATVTLKAGTDVVIDGASRVIAKSPVVRLGDENATEQLVLGTTYRAKEAVSNTAVQAAHSSSAAFYTLAAAQFLVLANAAVGPLAALKPGFLALQGLFAGKATPETAAATQIGTFEAAAVSYLSTVSNTK